MIGRPVQVIQNCTSTCLRTKKQRFGRSPALGFSLVEARQHPEHGCFGNVIFRLGKYAYAPVWRQQKVIWLIVETVIKRKRLEIVTTRCRFTGRPASRVIKRVGLVRRDTERLTDTRIRKHKPAFRCARTQAIRKTLNGVFGNLAVTCINLLLFCP